VKVGLPTIAAYALPAASELPPCAASWKPARERAALLVHDMQGYFVRAFAEGTSPIADVLANIQALREHCDRAGIPVFYTAQPGRQELAARGLQTAFWGPGMSSAPEDQDIVAFLAPKASHTVLTKWRYSAFQRSDFEARLRAAGRDQLIVTGVFAHIGCLLTSADAFMRDIETFFVADAVADFSRERHDQAVEYAAGRCAVPVLTSSLIEQL
jgi:bifunctional isochorismate lyase/aryl carrier protein